MTMLAASGSTQMLYSAAGVTLPSQHGVSAHHHAAAHLRGDPRIS